MYKYISMDTYYYALTLRRTVPISNCSIESANSLMDKYENIVQYLEKIYFGTEIRFLYEIVEKNNMKMNLHLHGVVKTHQPEQLINIPRQKGMRSHIELCDNQIAWDCYISKDPYTRENVIEYVHDNIRANAAKLSDEYKDETPIITRRIV